MYVPDDLIVSYRELVRLYSSLTDEEGRYRNEIQPLLVVVFPEFTQVFADSCRPTALGLLCSYSSVKAFVGAGIIELNAKLDKPKNVHYYGTKTARRLIELAQIGNYYRHLV